MTAPPSIGVDFVMVPTNDFDRAVEFYGTVLGLPNTARPTSRIRTTMRLILHHRYAPRVPEA